MFNRKGNTMKRLFLIPILLIFMLTGCLGLQTTESQDFTIHKLSRMAGIVYGLECPQDVEKALSYLAYLDTLKDGKLKDVAIDVAVKWAYNEYGKTSKTVILVAEVVDLLKIVIPDETGATIDTRLLDLAVSGMREGLLLTK